MNGTDHVFTVQGVTTEVLQTPGLSSRLRPCSGRHGFAELDWGPAHFPGRFSSLWARLLSCPSVPPTLALRVRGTLSSWFQTEVKATPLICSNPRAGSYPRPVTQLPASALPRSGLIVALPLHDPRLAGPFWPPALRGHSRSCPTDRHSVAFLRSRPLATGFSHTPPKQKHARRSLAQASRGANKFRHWAFCEPEGTVAGPYSEAPGRRGFCPIRAPSVPA